MRDVFMRVCLSVCCRLRKNAFFFYPNSTCSILHTAQFALYLLCCCLHNIFHIRILETTYIKYRLTSLLGTERDQSDSCTLSLTSTLEEGGWTTRRPNRLTPRDNIQYPLYRRLGEPQGRSGQVRKISPFTGIRSPDRPANPVASRYTDLAIPAH